MRMKLGNKGFHHHFLLPILAIIAVGAIGYYMLNLSKAAVEPVEQTQFKVGLVDDGQYVSKAAEPFSQVRDYTSGGSANKYSFAISKGGMRHTVLNVGIRELVTVDPTTRETVYVPNSIESRINNAVKWNAAHPSEKITVHLRFHVGNSAPEEWKDICGRVTMTDPQFGIAAVVPRWWVKDGAGNYPYRDLYKRAMDAIAPAVTAINDNAGTKNLIGTVNAPGEAPNYPEPMILYASSPDVRTALRGGGFTAAEHNNFMLWFPTAAAAFKKVGVELALNPYQNIGTDGKYSGANTTMYKDVAQALIDTVGANRTVLANYSARQSYTTAGKGNAYGEMYDWMSSMTESSTPVWAGVQMARPHNVADRVDSDTNEQWDDVSRWAASKGFHFAETTGPRAKSGKRPAPYGLANLWPKSYNDDSNDISDMLAIRKAFVANPTPAIPTDEGGDGTTLPSNKGYITIMWGRTAWQAAHGKGCVNTAGTRTLLQNADDLKSRGLFGVGGVVVNRTPDMGNPCFANYMKLTSWEDMAKLRDEYNWKFISQGMNYANMTKMDNDEARFEESAATLPILSAKGHNRAWGAFNYANNKQDLAAQRIVTKHFAYGRKYGDGKNTKSNIAKFPYIMKTNSINGGRCNNPRLDCFNMAMKNDRRTTAVTEISDTLSPGKDQWGVVQFYRLVEGKRGSLGTGFVWDCTSPKWQNRWTGDPELYCRESFLEAIDKRKKGAVPTDPASVAEKWGRTPKKD